MKPRVLVFKDSLLPLSETFIANQSLYLERYEAYFLGSRPISPAISLPQERTLLLNPEGKRSVWSTGFRKEVLFSVFGKLPAEAAHWLQYVAPRVIHAHFAQNGALALSLKRVVDVPLVVSLHGTDITLDERIGMLRGGVKGGWFYRLYMLRKRLLHQKAALFIVPSKFLFNKAIERGYPQEKLYLLPHGVDTSFFYPKPELVEFGRILYVGRLVERKGLSFLIKALAPLVSDFPELKLVVIGDGPKRKDFEEFARQLLRERVEFLGAQPMSVVRQEMQKAYVFSMPSIVMPTGEAETFGVVFLEAQACGVPVVAFSSGGIPEVVVDGETGFLAPEKDVEALREKIKYLMCSKELHDRLSRAAIAHVRENFDLVQVNRILESLYDNLVKSKNKH